MCHEREEGTDEAAQHETDFTSWYTYRAVLNVATSNARRLSTRQLYFVKDRVKGRALGRRKTLKHPSSQWSAIVEPHAWPLKKVLQTST
jgi:hypothetical protein